MEKLFAEYDGGRWIAVCPICRTPVAVLKMADKNEFICPHCYPGAYANAFQQAGKLFRQVPDEETREAARALAREQGAALQVVYPPNAREIENVLRVRRLSQIRWEPGETIADLLAQNAALGYGGQK